MFDSKFIFTFVGLIVAILAICKFNTGNSSEQFLLHGGLVARNIKKIHSSPCSINVSPAPQKHRSGCNVKYSQSPEKLAGSVEQLENLSGYQINNFPAPEQDENVTPSFGLSDDMTGNSDEVIVDRLIYANRNSRTRGAGDWIRGDLAIAPNDNNGWFVSQYSDPQTSLNTGALGAMAGFNEQTESLQNFLNDISNGNNTFVGGTQMSNNYDIVMGGPLATTMIDS